MTNISEEVLKEAKIIQEEIRTLLDESIQRKSDITELDVSKRCKDLASFMENLLQETRTPGFGKDVLATDERSFSVTISYVLVSPTLIYFASSTV